MARIWLPSSGRLYAFLAEINRQSPLVRCLFLNDQFYRNQNASTHLAAYTCLEELMEEGIALAMVYGELAALHMLAHAARYQYPEERSPQTAIRLARIASERGPGSPFAHRSMGFVLQRMGQAEEALPWMERAYELNRFDLTMAASLGYGLVFAGRYEEGTEMLRRAAQSSTVHPTWWNYGLFLGEFMLEQPEAAASAIAALRVSDRPHYLAARAIAAHMQGNREQTELLLTTLAERFPSFTADPLAFFAGANYPDDMAERLTVKLREVGLGATFGG
jgi:tetratricopeptide (TPR) repeat protein